MKLHKILALILAIIFCLSVLAACGGTTAETTTETTATETATETAAEPAAEEPAAEEETPAATVETQSAEEIAADNSANVAAGVAEVLEAKAPNNGDHYVIAYSCIAYAIAPFPTIMGDYIKQAIEDKGWEFNYLAAEGDVELQAEQVTTLCSTNPDMLVVWAGDASLSPIYVQEAYDMGIPVLLMMCGIDEEYRDMTIGFVGTNQVTVGYAHAQQIVDDYGTDSELLLVGISGVESQQDYQDKLTGFKQCLVDNGLINEDGSAGKWTFVGPEWCLSSRDTAQSAMENYIATYGDEIDVCVSFDDDLGMGAVNAIQEAGLGDQIKVYSEMGMIEMIQAIRDGKATFTLALPAISNANAIVNTISDYMNGIIYEDWNIEPDYVLVTADNCWDYEGDY